MTEEPQNAEVPQSTFTPMAQPQPENIQADGQLAPGPLAGSPSPLDAEPSPAGPVRMRLWKSHKVVRAARILSITQGRSGDTLLLLATEHLEEGSYDIVGVTQEWMEKRGAVAGGYFITYDDGYTSFSPAPPFEDGYTPFVPNEDTGREGAINVPTHPAVAEVLGFFAFAHLPERLQKVSAPFHSLACQLVNRAPESRETTVALRKLLEAKDAAVRAAL